MKETIIIIVIIIIIFGGDISTKKYLNKTADDLSNSLEELKENTIKAKENTDRKEITEQFTNVKEQWEKTSKMWSMIVVHQELDNIEQALTKAKANIEHGRLEDAISEIETSIFFAEHIKEREKLSLKNIF